MFWLSFLFFLQFIFISWRPITLQYCSGFCPEGSGGFHFLISNVEHLFMYLLAISVSSLGKFLFRSTVHFLNQDVCLFAVKLYEFFNTF